MVQNVWLVAAEVIYHAKLLFIISKGNFLSIECVGRPEDKGMLHCFKCCASGLNQRLLVNSIH